MDNTTPSQQTLDLMHKSVTGEDLTKQRWNQNVIEQSKKGYEEIVSQPFNPQAEVQAQRAKEQNRVKLENSVDDASIVDKIKAMGKAFGQTNDFVAYDKWVNKPEFKPNEEWMSTVSDYENVKQLIESNGIPYRYAEQISNTKSYEDFEYTMKTIKQEQQTNEYIDSKVGSGLKVTSNIAGALLGADIPLYAVPYLGELRIGRALEKVREISDVYDLEKARRMIESEKQIITAANFGSSAVVATAQTMVHDDRSLVDGLISFVLAGGINQKIINRSMGKLDSEYEHIAQHFKTMDTLNEVNPNVYKNMEAEARLQLGYDGAIKQIPRDISMPLANDTRVMTKVSVKNDWIRPIDDKDPIMKILDNPMIEVGAKSSILGKHIENITALIANAEKKIASLTKRLNNPTLGKNLIEKATNDLANEKDKLTYLTTAINKVKKAKTFSKSIDEVKKLKDNGFLNDDEHKITKSLVKKSDELTSTITKNIPEEDIISAAESVANKSKGERLTMKTINGKTFVGKTDASGKFKKFVNQNKTLTALAGVAIATSAANAASLNNSGGHETTMAEYAMYATLAFMGAYVVGSKLTKAMAKSATFREAVGRVMHDVKTTVVSEEMKLTPQGEELGRAYAAYNKSLVEMGFTFRSVYYKGNAEGKQLAKDLFYDPENNIERSVEVAQRQRVADFEASFYDTYDKNIDSFISEKRRSYDNTFDYVKQHGKDKRDFNLEVTNAIENKALQTDSRVRAVAEANRRILVDIGQRAHAAGVESFRALDDTYFPRLMKSDSYYATINAIDGGFEEGGYVYNETLKNFARMYAAKHPSAPSEAIIATARMFMESIGNETNRAIKGGAGDILGSPTARAMERIPLDMSLWKPIEVEVNGIKHTIGIEDVFERDIEQVMLSYVPAMEGHIALAEKGYKSFTQALDIAGRQPDADIKRIAVQGINQIIRRQNYDSTTTAAQASKIVSNTTLPAFMSLSAIMQIKEAGSSVIRASTNWNHAKALINETVNVLKNRGSDDVITEFFMGLDGRGLSIKTNKLHTRVFEDGVESMLSNNDSVTKLAMSASMKARDASMIMYMIAPITDIIQRLNARMNGDLLTQVAFGKKTLTPWQMQKYGITDEVIQKIRDTFKVNEKGYLTASSFENFDKNPELYPEIRNAIWNMGQTQMLSPTIGTGLAMFHESALGASMGNLMGFAFQSYATYGANTVKGIYKGDIMTAMDSFMWFATMYAAQELKDTIRGRKERTEAEKVRMALLQMPLTAPLALPSMLGGSDIQKRTGQMMVQEAESVKNLTGLFE